MKLLKLHSHSLDGKSVYFNAEMIIEFHDQTFSDGKGSVIYFLDIGIREVNETVEEIEKMIIKLQTIKKGK